MRALPAKRVSLRTGPEPGDLAVVATFYMDGDRLVVDWANDRYRSEIEERGIVAVVGGELGRVHLSDGRAFFDALEDAYARSSMVVVTSVVVEQS
jgi:hypothetical protein